jgi:enolase
MSRIGRASIKEVRAIQVLDSRARPTVSVEVVLSNGMRARACAPSGASTGSAEAHELRDHVVSDFSGDSVRRAVRNVSELLGPALAGIDITAQGSIDDAMKDVDGTANWSRVGGNASVATSLAVCRAAAMSVAMPLHQYIRQLAGGAECSMPMPMTNVLSGGLHTRQGMDIQDFLVIPNGASSYAEALDWICRVRSAATAVLSKRGISTLLADEGGLSPACGSIKQAFDIMLEAFEGARLRARDDVSIAIDMASTGLFDGNGTYRFEREGVNLNAQEIAAMLMDCARNYPLTSVEDPCAENDWSGWRTVTDSVGHIQLIGDDLFATQPERILRGKAAGAANAVLIKVNQNGSLTGALKAIATARQVEFRTIVSARSGETEDDFIADLAVGTDAGQIKIGSVRSSERQSKYNRLAWIAADEGDRLPLRNPWMVAGHELAAKAG